MDYPTYKQLRTYCWQALAAYLDTPNTNLAVELAGGSERAEIEYECRFAQEFWNDCKDLTPREHAAARLLAAISNHWLHVWQREPNPPDGLEPAPPLENWQVVELEAQTAKAVRDYALAVPEHAAAVLAAVEQAPPAPNTAIPNKRPPLQQQFQEQEILRVIAELKYSAGALPKAPNGKNGVKAEVRNMLKFTPGVFDKAWERLRGKGEIKDAI